ncbi:MULTISPECIES: L-histidine N(alpha)-methyltransferase [unclassified Wenzhouxiangella]|uniref:L-histidine N(alpha)-methyltransferase n=1 Tax=unclassified Wenzhouxiangella TaxID=2613841 RepID=UPI000E327E67|nr:MULTISPECIES: L-histidine N(alpha)-methyltransferase [unclassified Wenzhouxiangella]RFF28262.1 L-histidine N(alpha)-methyltransferase [Wenzhouxiangella sp. 15181]RFP69380.1 L-histidine N(alpha)-methyltransferase [Wenzhouxiangella sp. 15190]
MSLDSESERFREDVLAGLSAEPRSIPCKYLYDASGSALFEQICETPEYYVTRADLALHEAHLDEIASMIGPDAHVIELGSGAGIKTRRLLASLESPRTYTPIEISDAALAQSTRDLESAFPDIEIRPVQADYTQPIADSELLLDPAARRRIVYFPGSTISNFERHQAIDFLARLSGIAGTGGALLIGVDLVKPAERLIAAYDDAGGITAAFNRNLLERVRRELDAQVDLGAFAHEARYNESRERIEMHLVAQHPTRIVIDDHVFEFEQGESIHTENSHKYSVDSFRKLAAEAGLTSEKVWFDPDGLFSMHWLTAEGGGFEV